MKTLLKEQAVKLCFGIVATAIGVFLALLVNSRVNANSDQARYKSMLKAIAIEVRQNERILNESFMPNYEHGIVRREFTIRVTDEFLTTETFLNYADDALVETLTNYILYLKRANSFRVSDQKYKEDPQMYAKWGKGLTASFKPTLRDCNTYIQQAKQVIVSQK